MDKDGKGILVSIDKLTQNRDLDFRFWGPDQFRMMCILSGCDYLPGIRGMGLKSAWRLIRQHKTLEKVGLFCYIS